MSGRSPFAAVSIEGLYDTEWLYTMIHNKPVYVNSMTRTPKGSLIVLLSRHLVSHAEVPSSALSFLPPHTSTARWHRPFPFCLTTSSTSSTCG